MGDWRGDCDVCGENISLDESEEIDLGDLEVITACASCRRRIKAAVAAEVRVIKTRAHTYPTWWERLFA